LKGQKGLTLLETLIALTILSVIALSIFLALDVSHKTTATVDKNTTAESLTRTVHEFVKSLDYDNTGSPDYQDEVDGNIALEPGYVVEVTAVPIDPDTYEALTIPPDEDLGMQQIMVSVYYEGDLVMTTEDYKVYR